MPLLVELDAHDGAGVVTLRLSEGGFVSRPTDSPANAFYAPRLADPGNFERHLFGAGSTRGQSTTGKGVIKVLSGSPDGRLDTLDAWLNYGFDGRAVTIRRVASDREPLSASKVIFRGTAEQLLSDSAYEELSLKIYDRLYELNKPLLIARYAGTTITTSATAEGTVDLKDQVKPRIWGAVKNVPCVLVNPFDLIYQVSDGAVNSITVKDAGVALSATGNHNSIAALRSASMVPGQYATATSLGLFRLGGMPHMSVTADVIEGASAADRTAAQVVRRMMLHHGISAGDLPTASFSALDTKNSAEVGILVTGETTALSAVSEVLNSINAWMVPDTLGRFQVGRLETPSGTPVASFDETHLIGGSLERLASGDEGRGIPAWRFTVRYGRIYQVQRDSDLVGIVSAEERSFLASEWREAKAEDASVKTKHLQAPEITIDTCLTTQAAATAEAARLLAMHSVRRDIYRITVPNLVAEAAEPGAVVKLTFPRFGLGAGKLFVVIGRVDDLENDFAELTLWG